jgi:hypothetical protein
MRERKPPPRKHPGRRLCIDRDRRYGFTPRAVRMALVMDCLEL